MTTTETTSLETVIDTYFEAWNEADAATGSTSSRDRSPTRPTTSIRCRT